MLINLMKSKIHKCYVTEANLQYVGSVTIDEDLLEELKVLNEKHGLHMAFEGGEAETLVLDGPIFKKRLNILDTEKVWNVDSGNLLIKDAELVDKE